ncbi:MAG: 50S ribosomal protein L10 [ANME-2 cluster archaeon]|nr:50S ribosomal protein L10 [ANME-2 cluster archaeon]
MDEVHHSEHIPQWKKNEIEDIKARFNEYSVVGLIGIHGLPSKQFQQMRSSLRDSVHIKVSKNTLIRRAMEESSDGIKSLEKYIDQETGLIFSNTNSFKIFKLLNSSKTPSPIKGGMVSPKDIIVEKGPTFFPPGPIVGDLQTAGIPAGIDGGKVVIRETKVVAKEGEVVSQKLAAMLARLEIFPLELGLDLRATFEDGTVLEGSDLSIDEALYTQNFITAAKQAFNLSVNAAYPTSTSIQALISKAVSESRNLAVNGVIFSPEVMDILLLKAQSKMFALARVLSDEALDDDLKGLLGAQAKAGQPAAEEKAKPAEEVAEETAEEVTEEDAAGGLGALFG